MYPNPVFDRLFIGNLEGQNITRVRIVDMKGAVVSNQRLDGNSVSFDQFQEGIYFVELLNNNGSVIHSGKVLRIK